jgi:hypothetical protein
LWLWVPAFAGTTNQYDALARHKFHGFYFQTAPPRSDRSPPPAKRWGGEFIENAFAISPQPTAVIASAAKQSILAYFLGALWIASLRSQ